jgi:hypothetical protein
VVQERKMAETGTFWQRVGSMFRGDAQWRGDSADPLDAPPSDSTTLRQTSLAPGTWFRRSALSPAAAQVVQLAEAMQGHFRQQDARAQEFVQSLDRVGGILEQLAEAQRAQSAFLKGIADNTEAVGRTAASMQSSVARVPESLHAQAEAIRTVARQLEVSQEASTQLMLSLQQFGRAVDTLGSSGTAQVEVLQKLHGVQREQHDALAALVKEQSRRFTLLFVVALLVALVALSALGLVLLRLYGH